MPNCTCVIPFYNEGNRILKVLNEVIKIKEINEIICVDDGSTDNTAQLIKKNYPKIKIVYIKKNLGKTEAVNRGLSETKGDYILLLDADLRNLQHAEIANAISKILANPEIDIIVLRRLNAPFIPIKLIRGDILTSGERILKKKDLHDIINKYRPQRYQLEFAINKYMQDQNKNAYWMPSSALNTYPITKVGYALGLKKTLAMNVNILNYLGFKDYFKQLLFFCRKKTVN